MTSFVLFAQVTDPLSGGAGWVGAGLLGAVLAWLLFVHLPGKDKQVGDLVNLKDQQVTAMMKMQIEEREQDRLARHDVANKFQEALTDILKDHKTEFKFMNDQHVRDADRDRAAFLQRSDSIKLAIEKQTLELQKTIAESCKFYMPNGKPCLPHEPMKPISERT